MRFWLSGPRILGVRPGVLFDRIGTSRRAPSAPGVSDGSFVYVIRGKENLVKIGITTNPQARLAQLQTGSGFVREFAFLGYAKGGAYEIEQAAHAILARQRCEGEWFDVEPELAIAAVNGAAARLGKTLTAKPDDAAAIPPGKDGSWQMGILHLAFMASLLAIIYTVASRFLGF